MSMPSEERAFAGTYADGHSAGARRVEVRCGSDGLMMGGPGLLRPRAWAYADLRTSAPLRADDRDVLLSLQGAGTETVFVADPAFAPALLARAPQLSAARQRLGALRPGLIAAALAAVVIATPIMLGLHPAQAVARIMPQPTREALGRNVIASMAGKYKTCQTPASRAALDRLTQRLAGAASNPPPQVRVTVLDWPLVNAFAVPGGQIILTRGLIQAAGSADEVAGVLSHEMGHALELHPETSLVRALGLSAATQLVFAGSAGTMTNMGLVLTQITYTRIAEREADAHAVRILKGAGISSKGLADFFTRIDRPRDKSGSGGSILDSEVLRTHPLTAERITFVRSQPSYAAAPALSTDEWRALREACGASPLPVPPPPAGAEADREIADATKTLEANPGDVAALQQRARAYTRLAKHDLALADWVKVTELKPGDANAHVSRGAALDSLRRYEEALGAYETAIRLMPTHAGARNRHALSNRSLKRFDAALADLDELISQSPKYVAAHYNRALVHLDLKHSEDALRDFSSAIVIDKDYTAAYTQRGLIHEKAGRRQDAVADFKSALATNSKYESTAWAQKTARERLSVLGEQVQP
jgi:beta-barrel assembly-enhancing protease